MIFFYIVFPLMKLKRLIFSLVIIKSISFLFAQTAVNMIQN